MPRHTNRRSGCSLLLPATAASLCPALTAKVSAAGDYHLEEIVATAKAPAT